MSTDNITPAEEPSSTSTILGNETKTTTHNHDNDHDEKLIAALTKQLQYYFSPQNLKKDTYLNTIMQLNSGFVPITILSGFANVNKIIARNTTQKTLAAAKGSTGTTDSTTPTAPTTIADLTDGDVQRLLEKSALKSQALKMVLLDQDGKIIASHGDEEFEAKKGPLTFEAIGSCSEYVHVATESAAAGVNEDANENQEVENSSSSQEEERKASTVILRDVPDGATEDDIRRVFKRDANDASGDDEDDIAEPNITNVYKEVGQYWYVTIDSSTSQQDLVSILLNLRSKTICDEPVKARLKTQSTATQGVPMQGGGWNPYRSKYHGGGHGYNSTYSGDRNSFYSRKFTNRPFSKRRGGGKGGDSAGGVHKDIYDGQKKGVKVEKTGPPPPLVEEHFPGLSGSPKSTTAAGEQSRDPSNHDVEVKKDISIATNSGYAAALLKAAPPMPDVSRQHDSEKTSLPKPKSPNPTPARKKFDDTKSTGTISTDGSSADDKSSTSKTDSDIIAAVAPSPAKSWGSGPSFADILKKQEA